MTTKAIATATVDEIVEKPKRTTKSTAKSAKGVVKKTAPKKAKASKAVVETVAALDDSRSAKTPNPKICPIP